MNWIYVSMEMFYKTRISYLKLVSFLGLKPKIAMRHQKTVLIWWIWRCKEEILCEPSIYSNHFKIKFITSSFHRTQLFMNIMMYKEEKFHSLKENLTNITFWGRKETSVTATSIIDKTFELKHDRALME